MTIDTFPFFNELDLLELRLKEHADFVDRFVLVESTFTHQGRKKELIFEANKDRFKEFLPRITHLVYSPDQPDPDPWVNEASQRNHILTCLPAVTAASHVILHSDCDEIFSRTVVDRYLTDRRTGVYWANMRFFSYFIDAEMINAYWPCPFISTRDSLNDLFQIRNACRPKNRILPDGGWHFTSLGGVQAVREKFQSFAHKEWGTPEFVSDENLTKVLSELTDIERKAVTHRLVPVDNTYPRHLVSNMDVYSKYLYPQECKPWQ